MHKGSLESKVLPIDIDYMLVFAHQDVGRLYLSTLEAELEGPDVDDAGVKFCLTEKMRKHQELSVGIKDEVQTRFTLWASRRPSYFLLLFNLLPHNQLPVSLSVENSGSDYHMPDLGNHSTQNTMSESRKDAALKSATTPLLDDDPENNSSIKVEQKSKISLWQHIKDESKAFMKIATSSRLHSYGLEEVPNLISRKKDSFVSGQPAKHSHGPGSKRNLAVGTSGFFTQPHGSNSKSELEPKRWLKSGNGTMLSLSSAATFACPARVNMVLTVRVVLVSSCSAKVAQFGMSQIGALAAGVGLSASFSASRFAFSAANDSFAMVSRHKAGTSGDVDVRASGSTTVGAWFNVPELAVRDIYFVVPLDYSSPHSSSITIFVREVVADNIVRDAEYVRSRLLPPGERWNILGQSFGGFCAVTYLSLAPAGLRYVLLTGGLPPLGDGCTADTVYRECYKRVALQNAKFYSRFPQDEEVVRSIVRHLAEEGGVAMPSGGILTPRVLQLLGLSGLGSAGGFERLHYLLERAWDPLLVPDASVRLSHTFLRMVEIWLLDFDTNPLYALLHESIYCQGAASNWAAQRVREELGDQFDAVKAATNGQKVLFTGEMIFPWMFDDLKTLQPFKEVAEILAKKEDWPPLYDMTTLRNNKVPVAAAVYYEDMYVSFKLSEASAAEIKGIRMWSTERFGSVPGRFTPAKVLNAQYSQDRDLTKFCQALTE
ncbi:hypothetical protein AXG93_2079s1130 [Marchantia polymorpha subsp. ruderalis]|uniref:AB hydrolase-1 domain-containing protein n=1 Tax=Marchantia polymorpha subsp. ruderalis TaxID=1480154 RepID=A0A176VU42_MARPO|nr:hypothetical protein AXG93_2079s1130 [Marchantia polymorpha subsp. ruderalis]